MTGNPNKAIALRAQREFVADGDISAIDRYFAEPYIQHNAILPDGLDAIRQLFTQLLPISRVDILRVMADGDFVAFHQRVQLRDQTLISFDIYRMVDGKFAEHWDAMQPVADADDAAFFDGPREAPGDTEATRAIVTAFIDAAIVDGDLSAIETYVAPDIDRHGLGAGLPSLRAALEKRTHPARRCHRLLVEDGFALSLCEQEEGGATWAVYDLWRVAGGKIVDQWQCRYVAPAQTVSGGSVF